MENNSRYSGLISFRPNSPKWGHDKARPPVRLKFSPARAANARGGRQVARQQCWQSRHFPARHLLAFMPVVVVARRSRKQWWLQRPYPRLRCLVIPRLPFREHRTPGKHRALQSPRGQKGSGKCGNPLRCRFYRCFREAGRARYTICGSSIASLLRRRLPSRPWRRCAFAWR
jgi:hypothetical protein